MQGGKNQKYDFAIRFSISWVRNQNPAELLGHKIYLERNDQNPSSEICRSKMRKLLLQQTGIDGIMKIRVEKTQQTSLISLQIDFTLFIHPQSIFPS